MNDRLSPQLGPHFGLEQEAPSSLFQPGRNCLRAAHAQRATLLIDGENYFRSFVQAALQARHSIIILGWDFDSRTLLHHDSAGRKDPPPQLGPFLNYLVRRRRGLHIYILNWDYPMIFGTDREFPPVYGLGWRARRRVHMRYDNTHPIAGSHHQKIVVMDDCLAFSGGIDLTTKRWDTCKHSPDDQRRMYNGAPYPPFHDVMAMADDEAAHTLGEIARERWLRATGERIPAVGECEHFWPDSVPVEFSDVTVGIARTIPDTGEIPAVREVEALYLDMIGRAKHCIYIENQYFTAHNLADALAVRLAEPDGPEIVIVLRLLSHGWLEEHTMQALRTRLVAQLREADRWGRLRVFYPHVPCLREGTCLDIHSKVMVVDDEWARVGSANISNRSMAVDTECDLVFEAGGKARLADQVRHFRDRLIGEHLDVAPERVRQEHAARGSLIGAIAALQGNERSLRELEQESRPQLELSMATIADPEQPVSLDLLIEQFAPDVGEQSGPSRLRMVLLVAAVVAGLTALWRFTPLAEWLTVDRVMALSESFSAIPWAPLAVMLAYTPACFIMFPRPLITLFAVVSFGAWMGFVYSMTGILAAALVTYLAGLWMDRGMVRRLAGPRLNRVSEILRKRGLIAITLVRLVPVAPFAVEGLVAGAIRIKLWQFMLGTALGLLPGTLTTTVFGDQMEAALRDPARINYGLISAVVVALVAVLFGARRWFDSRFASPAIRG
jgi:phosphatidylserine/phosphatidylglycerophosphate/cardiolipin synthase-like enzyme/uncharacterized membrane protein YdjX (TVP38/TMEM64 family)